MNTTITMEVSILLNISPSEVWKSLTDKILVKKYFFGTEVTSSWEIGKPIKFTGEWENTPYEDKGTILELEVNKKLTYNYWSSFSGTEDCSENYARITYLLSENQLGQTTLTIIQDGFKDETTKNHSINNWNTILQNLKKLLEEGIASY